MSSPVSLWRMANYENGFPFKPEDFTTDGLPVIRIRQLVDPDASVDRFDGSLPARFRIHNGDLIFSWSGSLSVRIWNRGDAWLNQHLFKVRPTGGVNRAWLRWAIDASIPLFGGMMHGSAMTHLNLDMLKAVKLALPSLEQQQSIADYLDAETLRIEATDRLLAELISRLIEREDAVRDGLLDQLYGTHGELPLRRFLTRIEQGQSPQCDASPRQSTSEWAVLKLSAIKRGRFDANENKRLPEQGYSAGMLEVRSGDLLVTRANTPSLVGDVAVVGNNSARLLLPDLIYRLSLTGQATADFLTQVALGGRVRSYVESVARGSSQSMVKLRGEDIKSWPVPNATHDQQRDVVQIIRKNEVASMRIRSLMERQRELLAERRQALITAAVTGQFDLSTASGRGITDGVTEGVSA